ncbi:hypothetical protein [Actinotalea sp.]|uniref:hypothetical protein n=1 Tax=Actinotalea sp. TaxID=1872145 RepID=UPI003563C2EF
MTHTATDPAAPVFSPQVRTTVYVGSLIVNVAALATLGVLVILGSLDTVTAAALAGAVLGPLGLLNAGLGTAYRPTLTLGS